ncbi:MAG: hypothetical protein ACRET5_10360 [Steroidobacteraceae bacterium]
MPLAPPNSEVVQMQSFKEMLDSMNDAELGAKMRDRYGRLVEAHDMGLSDEHPADAWNSQNKILRDHKVAKDAAGSGLGARELEETDQPRAQDDPARTSQTPQAPARPGASTAAHDAAMEEFRIRQSGHADPEGAISLARARRINPDAVRSMGEIPGYNRLR